MKEIGRLITAMVTPFDEKGNVDYKQARKLAKALLASGSDGLVLAGTTGESPTLTNEEKIQLFAEVKDEVGKKGNIIAAVGNNDTADTVYLARESVGTGIDAFLVVVPYYNRPTQEGMYQHFKAVAEVSDLPVILYNVPGRTVANLETDTAVRLSEIKNVIGIKEASGNYEQISRIICNTHKDFLVWSGNDGDTFPIMALGGYGVISVVSHLVGNQVKQMMEYQIKGKSPEAAKIHSGMLQLIKALFIVANPMPVKYALNYLGFNVGLPRLPLTEPDEKSKAFIETTLKEYKIDLPIKK
jgi:4-hydroxy-tetrahydrodipicolinate synthase